jgi:hypothetical protein
VPGLREATGYRPEAEGTWSLLRKLPVPLPVVSRRMPSVHPTASCVGEHSHLNAKHRKRGLDARPLEGALA